MFFETIGRWDLPLRSTNHLYSIRWILIFSLFVLIVFLLEFFKDLFYSLCLILWNNWYFVVRYFSDRSLGVAELVNL